MEGLVNRHGHAVGDESDHTPPRAPAPQREKSPELSLSPLRPRKLQFGNGPQEPIEVESPPASVPRPAGKQPAKRLLEYLEERPDLAAYFDDFPYQVTVQERIKMCTAYAAYLKSTQPSKPRAPRKKSKVDE